MTDQAATPQTDGAAEAEKKDGEKEPFYKLTAKSPLIGVKVDFRETFGLGTAEFNVAANFKGSVTKLGKALEIASLVAIQLESSLPPVLGIKVDNGKKFSLPLSAFRSKTAYAELAAQENKVTAATLRAKSTELRAEMKKLGSEIGKSYGAVAKLEQIVNRQNI